MNGRQTISPRVGAIIIGITLTVASIGLFALVRHADITRQGETLITSVRTQIHRLSLLEWQSIASQSVDRDLLGKVTDTRNEFLQTLNSLTDLGEELDKKPQMIAAWDTYNKWLDKELHLIGAGDVKEAREVDEEYVDPAFENLDRILTDIEADLLSHGNRVRKTSISGAIGLILGAGLLIALLMLKNRRTIVAVEVLHAEQRALKRSEEALQQAHDKLEQHVANRTEELMRVNKDLQTIITDNERAEEALGESEQRYLTLIENANDIIFITDATGHFTFLNSAGTRIAGYDDKEVIGKEYWSVIRPDMREDAIRFFGRQFVKGLQNTYSEYPIITKDGREVWLGQNTSLLVENGHVTGFQAMARDITDRKRTEKQLEDTLERLRKAFGATVQVMASAVEARDPYTAGHQLRSANLARAIASEMGLSQEIVEGVRITGSIHDIGKLSIPAEILSKPTKLSDLEFALIKEHARRGFDMLKDVESPWPLAEIVYQHHERIDGSGYPRNLKGEEICLEARILTVADVVEAMASHRPYRPGLGINVALNEIEKNSGIFYDSTVADACLRLFREKGFKLEVI